MDNARIERGSMLNSARPALPPATMEWTGWVQSDLECVSHKLFILFRAIIGSSTNHALRQFERHGLPGESRNEPGFGRAGKAGNHPNMRSGVFSCRKRGFREPPAGRAGRPVPALLTSRRASSTVGPERRGGRRRRCRTASGSTRTGRGRNEHRLAAGAQALSRPAGDRRRPRRGGQCRHPLQGPRRPAAGRACARRRDCRRAHPLAHRLGAGRVVPRSAGRRAGAGPHRQFRQCQRLHRPAGPGCGGAHRGGRRQGARMRRARSVRVLHGRDRRAAAGRAHHRPGAAGACRGARARRLGGGRARHNDHRHLPQGRLGNRQRSAARK